jgi:transposase
LFEAVPDHTVVPKQAYISLARREKILELPNAGQAVREIANQTGVSFATVYRTVAEIKDEGHG